MGCAASAPQDVDTLPIKAHCRTAFSRCSTTERVGQTSERVLPNPEEEGHDVVLCYPLGGTVFGLELQARYEKMESVSVWTLDQLLSPPATPMGISKSMSGGIRSSGDVQPALEIKPAAEVPGASMSANVALSREIRMCRRGVVVLVTAGSTWDEGVLNCLRLAGKCLRPLVIVHCVQSCPLPALEEWPLDIRPVIAASGLPIKYLTQHSAEALRGVEQRMLEAAEALSADARTAQFAMKVPSTGQWDQGQQQQQMLPFHKAIGQAPQQQPTAIISLNCNCLNETMWASPAPSRPSQSTQRQPQVQQQQGQQQQGQQQSSTHQAAFSADAAAGPAGDAADAQSPNAAAAARPMLATSPSPLSLAALLASDSEICRRAAQLMGPWTDFRATAFVSSAVASAASGDDGSSRTPVEALVVSVPTPGQEAPVAEQPTAPLPGSTTSQHCQYYGYCPGREQGQAQKLDQAARIRTTTVDGNRGSIGGRCVLRYHDPGWSTPVAFVCAQLEAELGRANVSVQMAAAAAAVTAPTRQPSSVPPTGTSVQLSLQSVDSGGNWSQKSRRRHPDQQRTMSASMGAAAAAAATSLQDSQRSSSGGSSRCCSASCGPRIDGVSGSTSRRTSGGASQSIARGDDELEPFARPSVDGFAVPPQRTASTLRRSCSTSTRRPTANGGCGGGGGEAAEQSEMRSMSWCQGEEDSEHVRPPGGDGADKGSAAVTSPSAAACLVYFMAPGLSAPLRCLSEIGTGLAQGRRIFLVVDGECCQRLPDYAPPGMTAEAWRAVRRLWHERLLYVTDYHTPFCALLKQVIVAAAAAAAAVATP